MLYDKKMASLKEKIQEEAEQLKKEEVKKEKVALLKKEVKKEKYGKKEKN